jgi:hypothetical protein
VYLSGCVETACPALYSGEREGRAVVGCLNGVFTVEIDRGAFDDLQATRCGFGALRAVRPPLPICRTSIDQAFEHRAVGACRNPDFLLSGSLDGIRVSVTSTGDSQQPRE